MNTSPALRIRELRKLITEQNVELERLRAELDNAKQETARLVKKLHREQDYAAFLEDRRMEMNNHE